MPPPLVFLQAAEAGHHGFGGAACWDDNDSVFSDFDEETFTSAIDNVDELVYFGECFQGVLDCAVPVRRNSQAGCRLLHWLAHQAALATWPRYSLFRCSIYQPGSAIDAIDGGGNLGRSPAAVAAAPTCVASQETGVGTGSGQPAGQ